MAQKPQKKQATNQTQPTIKKISKSEYTALKKKKIRNGAIALACTFALGAGAGCGAYYGIENAINQKHANSNINITAPVETWQPVEFQADKSIVGVKINKDLAFSDWKPNLEGVEVQDLTEEEGILRYRIISKGPDGCCWLTKIVDVKKAFPDYKGEINPNADLWSLDLFGFGFVTLSKDLKDLLTNNDFTESKYFINSYNSMIICNYNYSFQRDSGYILTSEECEYMNRLTDIVAPIYSVELPDTLKPTAPQTETATANQLSSIFE